MICELAENHPGFIKDVMNDAHLFSKAAIHRLGWTHTNWSIQLIAKRNSGKRNMNLIEYKVNINGIDVKARYNEENINGIFIPLLRDLTYLQRTKNKRILAFLAAPPGAGKTDIKAYSQRT